uniref:Uncharacterized protein n=1 Tax=Photinus pyralis TaxID=7054 RepID=A0A1Y1LXJ4_PHOPY
MWAVTLATSSFLLRNFANGHAPQKERKTQIGTSKTRAMKIDLHAGRAIPSKLPRLTLVTPANRLFQMPHSCPTNVNVVASSAETGTMTRPQRIVLKTLHAVAYVVPKPVMLAINQRYKAFRTADSMKVGTPRRPRNLSA